VDDPIVGDFGVEAEGLDMEVYLVSGRGYCADAGAGAGVEEPMLVALGGEAEEDREDRLSRSSLLNHQIADCKA